MTSFFLDFRGEGGKCLPLPPPSCRRPWMSSKNVISGLPDLKLKVNHGLQFGLFLIPPLLASHGRPKNG